MSGTLASSIDGIEIARPISFSKFKNFRTQVACVWSGARARMLTEVDSRASNAVGAWLTSNATSISRAVFFWFVLLGMLPSRSLLPVRYRSIGTVWWDRVNFATAPKPRTAINKTIRDVIDRAAIIVTPQFNASRRLLNTTLCVFVFNASL